MSNTALIASPIDFQNYVCLFSFGTKSKFDQHIKFAKIGTGAEQGKVIIFETTKFRKRGAECDGPILPHEKKVGTMELGPKRPCLKIVANPEDDFFHFLLKIELTIRSGYEFAKSRLNEAFPDLLTFYFRDVTLPPTRTAPNGIPAHEVLVVGKNGAVKTLSEFLPQNLNAVQTAAVAQLEKDKRIVEKDVIDEQAPQAASSGSPSQAKTRKTYVFESIMPKIDAKTGRLYLEMHLFHKTFPKDPNGQDGPRKYRGPENPYRTEMSDVKQWGIEIPLLVKVDGGGYAMVQGSDWVQDPTFRAVTKDKEHNNFIGTLNFQVDSVMEGSGNVKVWWKCSACKQPEVSSRAQTEDYGEEIIVAPAGAAVSLGGSPVGHSAAGVLRGALVSHDDDEEP